MGFATFRDEVKTTLEAVNGIGRVYDTMRLLTHWEKFKQDAVKDGRVNIWEITRLTMEEDLETPQGQSGVEPCFRDLHLIGIIGHFSVDDKKKSEKVFQDLIDAIVAAFRVNNTLGAQTLIPAQAQVPSIGHEMFASVLCHAVQITFLARERTGG
jgi:hypothetical protein